MKIEFNDLEKSEMEEVVEGLIKSIILEAIDLHRNIELYLSNENEDGLEITLKLWGEHRNFDDEFLIGTIPNQIWYNLCNGVLYLKEMVMVNQKIFGIIQEQNLDLLDYKLFLKVISVIKDDIDYLYSKVKKKFSQKVESYVM